jgi:hypothetical protein
VLRLVRGGGHRPAPHHPGRVEGTRGRTLVSIEEFLARGLPIVLCEPQDDDAWLERPARPPLRCLPGGGEGGGPSAWSAFGIAVDRDGRR